MDIAYVANDLKQNAVVTDVDVDGNVISCEIDAGFAPDGEAQLRHIRHQIDSDDIQVTNAVPAADGEKLVVYITVRGDVTTPIDHDKELDVI